MKKIFLIIYFLNLYLFCHAQINISDSLALVDIYNATNGSNWTHSTNWLTGPVKTWYGVIVPTYPGDSTRVRQLNLINNNLTGYIPSSIGNLSYIAIISLDNNNLTGTIPHTIGRLLNLQEIWLENNQLSGNLTDSIYKITNLFAIDIGYNNFTGNIPDSLNQLPHLNAFYLENNQFERLPDFSGIPNAHIACYYVQNNHLTFADIEPNMTLGSFVCSFCEQYYAPQFDSINSLIDTTVQENSIFEMHCTIGGQYNQYQWTKNGVDIPLATDSVLAFSSIALSDSGVYSCRVTNSIVPNLTYHRRMVTVHVDKLTESLEDYTLAVREFIIYPIPATDELFIEFNHKEKTITRIKLFNILGFQVINTIEAYAQEGNTIIDVSKLSSGMYILKIETNSKTFEFKILVK